MTSTTVKKYHPTQKRSQISDLEYKTRKSESGMSKDHVSFDFPVMFVFLFYLILFSSLRMAKGQCLKAVCKTFVFF